MIRFVHVSDLHFPIRIPFWKLKGKMFSGYLNYAIRRRKKYSPEAIRAFVQKIKTLNYDVLLITGDITNVSHEKEFSESYQILKPLLNERTFVIPGNHDRYKKESLFPTDLFQKYYGNYTGSPIPGSEDYYIRVKEIGNYLIVGWDSNEPTGFGDASGYVNPEIVKRTIKYIQKVKKPYLLTCHHPIWNPKDKQESAYHKMRNREEILKMIKDTPPLAYFHGHIHTNWLRKKTPDIPFHIFNSASSTRQVERGYFSGFHQGNVSEESLDVQRFHFVSEANDYLETTPVLFT